MMEYVMVIVRQQNQKIIMIWSQWLEMKDLGRRWRGEYCMEAKIKRKKERNISLYLFSYAVRLGTFVLSQSEYEDYFLKSAKIRQLISEDFMTSFNEVDLILTPTTTGQPPKIHEVCTFISPLILSFSSFILDTMISFSYCFNR